MDQTLKDALTQIIGSKSVWVLTQFAVGIGLLYVIDKFFKVVEENLNDDTKLEIAVWLLGRKQLAPVIQSWPDTFAKVFDRVFGTKHLSWKCFFRSTLATFLFYLVGGAIMLLSSPERPTGGNVGWMGIYHIPIAVLFVGVPLDFASLLQTRYFLTVAKSDWKAWRLTAILVVALVGTLLIAHVAVATGAALTFAFGIHFGFYPVKWEESTFTKFLDTFQDLFISFFRNPLQDGGQKYSVMDFATNTEAVVNASFTFFYPPFFTSIWLWLYAGSGFVLKAARHFDIGFRWFNRKFDIEKRPLQSIGLVAGVLVALVYWAAVIVSRITHHG